MPRRIVERVALLERLAPRPPEPPRPEVATLQAMTVPELHALEIIMHRAENGRLSERGAAIGELIRTAAIARLQGADVVPVITPDHMGRINV